MIWWWKHIPFKESCIKSWFVGCTFVDQMCKNKSLKCIPSVLSVLDVCAVQTNISFSFVQLSHTNTQTHTFTHIWQQSKLEEEVWRKWHLKQKAFVVLLLPLSYYTDACKSADKIMCTYTCVFLNWLFRVTEMALDSCIWISAIREQEVIKTSGEVDLRLLTFVQKWKTIMTLTLNSALHFMVFCFHLVHQKLCES